MTTASILACRSVLAAAALVVALGLATPAQAFSPGDLERLAAGKPIVRVTEAEGPIDGQVDAVIDIAAGDYHTCARHPICPLMAVCLHRAFLPRVLGPWTYDITDWRHS